MNNKLKVLLSAYSCEPGKGSEPEVGWRWATSLAHQHDVTVITRTNNEEPIRRALANFPEPHPVFSYYDPPRIFIWMKKKGMPVALFYLFWQLGVRWRFRKRLTEFDIIHHITFNSFRQPGFWWFCKPPVLLGPLGGGQICPWPFFRLMRGRQVAEFIRSCSVLATPLLLHVRMSFAAATKILVANADTEARIPRAFRKKTQRLLETGIPNELMSADVSQTGSQDEIKILWLSWLIPIKAPELVIRAFALALKSNPRLQLTMAGDGPLAPLLRDLATELGVSPSITWQGRVIRQDIPRLFEAHDVFVFTSLRDTSGNVLLEAMASGLPCITLLHQGAAEIATDETAIRIKPLEVDKTVQGIAGAMLELAASPDMRHRMGQAASERISSEYLWERKACQMTSIYESVVSRDSS